MDRRPEVSIGTVKTFDSDETTKPVADDRDVEENAPEADKRDKEASTVIKDKPQKTKFCGGKWRTLALLLALASIIVVIVVPPSVIVPRKKAKAASLRASKRSPITVAEVEAAQKAWGDSLVKISKTYTSKGIEAAKEVAQEVLDAAYGYSLGIAVSFKPTLANGEQTFRPTNDGALSYFVGHDPNYPHDHGFALKGWTDVVSVRAGVLIDASGKVALSMGNVYFKNDKNEVTKVDKTWVYLKGDDGVLRIILHHSSLPYVAKSSMAEPWVFPNRTQVTTSNEVQGFIPKTKSSSITIADVEAAQKAWGDALIAISSTYSASGIENATALAEQVLDAAYGYKVVPVLFKPTLASGNQTFRLTNEGALAYFVGENPNYPDDHGFAVKGWVNVTSVRSSVYLHPSGDIALSMGNVFFGNKDGSILKVDKTWVYYKDDDGVLRIILHHSSLPYVSK